MKATLKAPEGRKGCMRYVIMVVAIGLLVVGFVAYAAQAAQTKPAYDSRLLFGPARESVSKLDESIQKSRLDKERAAYIAQVQQLQQQMEQERIIREAVQRFGQWGPDLVVAAGKYGQDPSALYRVMSCESKGDPNADNGVNKGLFQFDPGTWANTPWGSQSIYDGHAQVEAAAWMWSQGRKGEWGCS